MLQLQHDIALRDLVLQRAITRFPGLLLRHGECGSRMIEPLLQIWGVVEGGDGHDGAQGAAIRMAAHDDVLHREDGNGIFDGTGLGEVARRRAICLPGGMRLPTLRMVKSSPGSAEASRDGTNGCRSRQ